MNNFIYYLKYCEYLIRKYRGGGVITDLCFHTAKLHIRTAIDQHFASSPITFSHHPITD